MAYDQLEDQKLLGEQRGKINNNFQRVFTEKAEITAVLTKVNINYYVPTQDYHPATKGYADSLTAQWHAVYNPQDITGDVFDRDNHTGQLAPSVIAEDADNNFVSEDQILSWNAKEDSIGVKNSAFNKNFGTAVNTVAEGNHSHTKEDIGLGNVDNTSDQEKAISDPTQAALDGKLDSGAQDLLQFTPQDVMPDHFEGTIFYDNKHKAMSGYCEVEGITINYGFEDLVRVWNGTGATIPNGTPCRQDGVHVPSYQANVVPAQADSIANSVVLGLATHDIPNNTIGYLCVRGGVHDMNTSSFLSGDLIYLSDTVAGGLVSTPPDIVVLLGSIRKVGVTDGVLFAGIRAVIPLVIFGQLYDKAATMDLTTSYQNITGFTNSDLLVIDGDASAGTLTVPNSGKYRLTFSTSMTVPTKATARSLILRLYDVTNAEEVVHSNIAIGKDTTAISRSFSPPFNAIAGNVYIMQIIASEAITGVSFDDISFDLQSVALEE